MINMGKESISKKCKYCGIEFSFIPKSRPRQFCSISCAGKYPRKKIRVKSETIIRNCDCCKISYQYIKYPSIKNKIKRFCSQKCANTILTSERGKSDFYPVKETYVCVSCGLEKPNNLFSKTKSNLSGFNPSCKECCKNRLSKNEPKNIGSKICINCGVSKSIVLFYVNRNLKDGRNSKCKQCTKIDGDIYRTKPHIKIKKSCSARIYQAIIRKSGRTLDLVGCSIDFLMNHLENKFLPGMTWDNYGKWHIDHIRPCASFDLANPEEQKKCFHYTNLQPLWEKDNLKKGNKIMKDNKDGK